MVEIMNDRTNSGGGASALVATVALAAALIGASCAERSAPAGYISDDNGRAVVPAAPPPAPRPGVGGPITLEEPDIAEGMIVDAADFGPELAMEVGGRDTRGAPGLTVADTDAAGEAAKKAKDARARRVKTWKRVEATPNTSRLLIGDKEELELKGLQANVRVDGFRARVVLDL
ncbi:MAG: hypothetical protein ACYTKD_26275, partial [Planctomycetota bacterium]